MDFNQAKIVKEELFLRALCLELVEEQDEDSISIEDLEELLFDFSNSF